MLRGTVVKAYSGYYYVETASGIWECSLRGRFKLERFQLYVGDEVEITVTEKNKGVIERILPRRSLFKRPNVANVDQVVLTFAAANPALNLELLDRFLVLAELSAIPALVCLNKIDIVQWPDVEPIIRQYSGIGYQVFATSAKVGTGIAELRNALERRISVFAGPSGVGKSTLLNTLEPGFKLKTGELSAGIGRGRHTTRFAQLLPLSGGGFVVDTPGFSLTDLTGVEPAELRYCFREFLLFEPECRFTSCLHIHEPDCAVKAAVQDGKIAVQRYRSYTKLFEELRNRKD